ncbi:barH-like 2 homeobox protein [Branchiostoma floridae]|uniref:BarH-like 2 homeobox protein n=1 Tax=Branchiostoma floridae TaxID=7739 RepID=A0A9J7KN66_BRAFL|nr:barH-like 2 homeobox protein [Branchiostoma floridae]
MLSFSVEAILSKPSSHGRDRWEPGDREHADGTRAGHAPWRTWADPFSTPAGPPGQCSVQPPWMYRPNPASFRPFSTENFIVTPSPSSSSSDSQAGDSQAHRAAVATPSHERRPDSAKQLQACDETEVDVDEDGEGDDNLDPTETEDSPEDSRRRQRRLFSGHQVMELETRFLEKNYLSRIERICLANALNLSETQRTKARRKHLTRRYWGGRWPGGYRVQPGLTYGPPDDTMRAAIEDLIRRYENGQVETRLTN